MRFPDHGAQGPDDLVEFVDVDATEDAEDVLDAGRPASRARRRLVGFAAAVVVAAVATGAIDHVRSSGSPPRPRTQTTHLALAAATTYPVTGVAALGDREVLWVDWRPTPSTEYGGGRVTLYTAGAFHAAAFERTAQRLIVGDRAAYFGSYDYVESLAWPVGDGRWVCVSGFIAQGAGTSPAVARAAELAVAPHVRVH